MGEGIFCIIGAMVGAGLASGREIMQFFSQYGALSWLLVGLAAALTGLLSWKMMRGGDSIQALLPGGRFRWMGHLLMGLLLAAVGGGMTAAAGELAALTVPVHHARFLGSAGTPVLCAALARKSLRGLAIVSKLLLPVLLLAFLLCLCLPETVGERPTVSITDGLLALLRVIGYCGMNALLSAEIICEAGSGENLKHKKYIAAGTGIVLGLLLALGNGALIRHTGALENAALPTIMLLRAYGKAGFYLSAAVLYLAVATTLIASLRGLRVLIAPYVPAYAGWIGVLSAAGLSLIGFQEIVATAYPALGWAGLGMLFFPFPTKSAKR